MIRKINSAIFVIACFLLFQYASFLKLKTRSRSAPATVTLTVDNYVRGITVNGVPVALSGDIDNWQAVKTITLPGPLKTGDVLTITGENQGGVSSPANGNPAAIIASVSFYEFGTLRIINTDEAWSCDGTPAQTFGANSESTIWFGANGGKLPGIQDSAKWIWNSDLREKSTCQIIIPRKKCGEN
jgi:hypothetical protein